MLLSVFKRLLEQAAVISKAYAVRGKAERRKAVDKAGCQSSKAAVSKGRLVFELLQFCDVFAGLCQFRLHIVVNSEVDQVIAKKFSDQELRGNIIDFLLSAVISRVPAGVLRQCKRSVVEFQNGAFSKVFAGIVSQFSYCHIILLWVSPTDYDNSII